MAPANAQPQEGQPAPASVPSPPGAEGTSGPVGAATDDEEPPDRRPRAVDPDAPPDWVRNPKVGLVLELGMGGGGDQLATATLSNGKRQTLNAGDAVTLSVGLMITPLWVGDRLGVGVSGTAGYKSWSIGASNGSIALSRYPLIAAVHLMPRLAPRWLLLARGGIDKDAEVSVSGRGLAAGIGGELSSRVGGFVEAGIFSIFLTPEQRGAMSLTVRYTNVTYAVNGVSIDAQSVMVLCALYYHLESAGPPLASAPKTPASID